MIEDHENAVRDFDVLIKKNPKNAHAYFRRAFSLKSLKNYSEAAEDFEQAKILDPLNPKMVVNYKKLKGVSCIVLCKPGEEKVF
jgi:tetratricopeptide (TPR) repeat protein